MGIEANNLPLENIYNRRCGLIVVLPTKLEHPNGDICNLMRDIVNGYISLQEFKKISGLFEEERKKIRLEEERVEEERRKIRVEKGDEEKEYFYAAGKSGRPFRKSRKSRKSRKVRKSRKSRKVRKSRNHRTWSRIGSKKRPVKDPKKRRTHKKYYTDRKK
jgi:hypothetical protein